MDTVRLESGYKDLIATVHVLPFQVEPDVVMWSSRVFVRVEPGVYREAVVALALGDSTEMVGSSTHEVLGG